MSSRRLARRRRRVGGRLRAQSAEPVGFQPEPRVRDRCCLTPRCPDADPSAGDPRCALWADRRLSGRRRCDGNYWSVGAENGPLPPSGAGRTSGLWLILRRSVLRDGGAIFFVRCDLSDVR